MALIKYLSAISRAGGSGVLVGDFQIADTNSPGSTQAGWGEYSDYYTGDWSVKFTAVKISSAGVPTPLSSVYTATGTSSVICAIPTITNSGSANGIGATDYFAIRMDIWVHVVGNGSQTLRTSLFWTLAQGVDPNVTSASISGGAIDEGYDGDEGYGLVNYVFGGSTYPAVLTLNQPSSNPPSAGTIGSLTTGIHGQVTIPFTAGANTDSIKVYRSSDNVSFTAIPTQSLTITNNGTAYTIIDRRPTFGTPLITEGSVAYYKVAGVNSLGETLNSNGVHSITPIINVAASIAEQAAIVLGWANNPTYLPNGYCAGTIPNGIQIYYPAQPLFTWASAYYETRSQAWLDKIITQWNWLNAAA